MRHVLYIECIYCIYIYHSRACKSDANVTYYNYFNLNELMSVIVCNSVIYHIAYY